MKEIRLIVACLAAALLATSALHAKEAPGDQSEGKQREAVFRELNLTDNQKAALDANRKERGEKMRQLRDEMREKKAKMREKLDDLAVSRDAIEPLLAEIKALQAQMTDLRVSAVFAVREVLTVEQFAKFQEMSQKKEEEKRD